MTPNYHKRYGEFCWSFLDERILIIADKLRKRYGPMNCNTWHYGGDRTESGLRAPGQKHYRPTSQHAFGRAVDLIPLDTYAVEIRNDLKKNGIQVLDLPNYIDSVTFEDNVSWLHVDVRNGPKGLNFFSP